MDKLQHIIEQKQALLAREEVSCPALDYSEGMTAEEQKRYINYLAERVREADLGMRARDLVLQDFLDKQKEYEERLSKLDKVMLRMEALQSSLEDEIKRRESAERKVADLTAKLKYADKNRFGNKRHSEKNGKAKNDEKSDRRQDKDDFDGTLSSLPDNSIAIDTPDSNSQEASVRKKERDLSNRPETYKTMGVQGTAKEYKSDLSKVPGRIINRRMVPVFHLEMNIVEERFEMVQYVEKGKKPKWGYLGDAELKSVMSDGYNAYVFIGNELKTVEKSPNLSKTIHQVCLAHLKAKFNKASEQAGDRHADIFLEILGYFYEREGSMMKKE